MRSIGQVISSLFLLFSFSGFFSVVLSSSFSGPLFAEGEFSAKSSVVYGEDNYRTSLIRTGTPVVYGWNHVPGILISTGVRTNLYNNGDWGHQGQGVMTSRFDLNEKELHGVMNQLSEHKYKVGQVLEMIRDFDGNDLTANWDLEQWQLFNRLYQDATDKLRKFEKDYKIRYTHDALNRVSRQPVSVAGIKVGDPAPNGKGKVVALIAGTFYYDGTVGVGTAVLDDGYRYVIFENGEMSSDGDRVKY